MSYKTEHITDEILPKESGEKLTVTVAKFNFFMCMFFIIFGTGIPFSERAANVEEIAESNIVNQIVFSLIFIISLILVIKNSTKFSAFIKYEKYFAIFILWCGLTIIWSDSWFISFKRYFQYLAIFISFVSTLLIVEDRRELLKLLNYIFIGFILISFFSSLSIPQATDNFGNWKGLASSKNHLGEMAILGIVYWSFFFPKKNLNYQLLNIFLILISLILLVRSNSVTSLLTFMIFIGIIVLVNLNKPFEQIGLGKNLITLTISIIIILSILTFVLAFDYVTLFFNSMDKDVTLTGRIDIWAGILNEAKNHLLLGGGFQSFWIKSNPFLQEWYETYFWIVRQAHNGYVDLLNEIGIVGLSAFILFVVNFYIKSSKVHVNKVIFWFFTIALILNLTESTLLTPRSIVGSIFMFAYVYNLKASWDRNLSQLPEEIELIT